MNDAVRQRLLQVNRTFYATVAQPFNETRQGWTPGKRRLLTYLPTVDEQRPVRVADIGCGNGRFALMLESLGRRCEYTGLDGNRALLSMAEEQCRGLSTVNARFVEADLALSDWRADLAQPAGYDMVVCLATLQHMPGFDLRSRVMGELASLLRPSGRLVVSAWQFLESQRFRERLIDWKALDLNEADLEIGDALLPWKQGTYAIRYVHQIDEKEMVRLASAAGLSIVDSYRADGKEGNLNLYAIMTSKNQYTEPFENHEQSR